MTVGMVCQTCGTDYAPGDSGQQQAADPTQADRDKAARLLPEALLSHYPDTAEDIAYALAAARADKAARHDKLVTVARDLLTVLDDITVGYKPRALDDAMANLRAVLDTDRD